MDSKLITRKDFFTLTLTLVGSTVVGASCGNSDDSVPPGSGGGGAGTGGAPGTGGVREGGAGTGGSTGTGGAGGSGGGTGGAQEGGSACVDPLTESQVADSTGHEHGLVVRSATLDETTMQMVFTGPFPVSSGGHIHTVTLLPADLATLKGGGSVMVTSSQDGTPLHGHTFRLSCH